MPGGVCIWCAALQELEVSPGGGTRRYKSLGCRLGVGPGATKAWGVRLGVGPGATKAGGVAYGWGPAPGGPRAARGAVPSLRSSTFRIGHDGTSLSRHALGPASLLAHPGLPPFTQRCGMPVTGPHPPAPFALCWLRITTVPGFQETLCPVLLRKKTCK